MYQVGGDQMNPVQSQILDTYQRNTFCGFVFFDESGSQLTGSVRRVIDVLDGTTAQSFTYDEFGNQLSNSNPDFQPFGYAGGLTDYHTDLIRFGARDYDPSVGRWTSKEPLGFAGALNFYVYCDNDGVNYVDPDGEFQFGFFVAVVAAVLTVKAIVDFVQSIVSTGNNTTETRDITLPNNLEKTWEDLHDNGANFDKLEKERCDAIKDGLEGVAETTSNGLFLTSANATPFGAGVKQKIPVPTASPKLIKGLEVTDDLIRPTLYEKK
jgi:RHS repeat-associated protein